MLKLPGNISKLSIPQALQTKIREGMSDVELAYAIGVSISSLRAWINGVYNPSIDNVMKVMAFLGYGGGGKQSEWRMVTFEDQDGTVYNTRLKMFNVTAVQIAVESGSNPTLIGRMVADSECSHYDAGVMILAWLCDIKYSGRSRNPAALAVIDERPYVVEIEQNEAGKKRAMLHGIGMAPRSVINKKNDQSPS